ncbi:MULTISPECIES: hypothetical protein [Nocardia]|uniref:hypothetical protein n=1 Tax=Nocardia TaxID=1817 RepID=UPI000D68AD05|nr:MULTISPECIES: hypothetical protein [Nocardia]
MTCPESEQPRTPIEELLRRQAAAALLGEAEAVMRGERHLTIEHGYPETDDETARLEQLRTVAWRGADGAHTRSIGGGGDYTTITVEGPAADAFIDHLAELATALGPSWWRVRRSAR